MTNPLVIMVGLLVFIGTLMSCAYFIAVGLNKLPFWITLAAAIVGMTLFAAGLISKSSLVERQSQTKEKE